MRQLRLGGLSEVLSPVWLPAGSCGLVPAGPVNPRGGHCPGSGCAPAHPVPTLLSSASSAEPPAQIAS